MTGRPYEQLRGVSEWPELQRAVADALERSESLTDAGPKILAALARAEERARSERLLTEAEQAASAGSFELELGTRRHALLGRPAPDLRNAARR